MDKLKVLVTGANGFVGSHFTKRLIREGHEVIPIDLNPSLEREYEVYKCDITDFDAINEYVKMATQVAHFAGIVDVKTSMNKPILVWNVNAQGTTNLVESSRINKIRKFMYASTNSVYGSYPLVDNGIGEDYPMDPVNPYAASKASGEFIVRAYGRAFEMKTTCLRFAGIYGPGKTDNVFGVFVRNAIAGNPLKITGGKIQTRNFTYIDDAIQGAYLALTSSATGVFNITGGFRVGIHEVAEVIADLIPGTQIISQAPARGGDPKIQGLLSIEKAKKKLGYNPKIEIEEGVKRFVEWYISTNIGTS